jgi:hypothetical protein
VLVVTDDDAFSAAMKLGLRDVDMLSLTEAAVWTAVRAGLDVTRGVGALMIDGSVGGLLQLRLYEKLRPSDVVAHVPVIFARARFGGGLAHDLDFYLPPDGTPEQAVRLICHVLGIPMLPAGVAARLGTPAAAASVRRRRTAPEAALPPGLLQRLGLWGAGAALLGFTFWPVVGSAPVRDAVSAPLAALSGAPASTNLHAGR